MPASQKVKLQTSTVSICATPEEAEAIRDAAAVAGLTVSAWGASRIVTALSSSSARNIALRGVREMKSVAPPRGSRSARMSMVMRLTDHDELRALAEHGRVNAHSLAQAILFAAAGRELTAAVPEAKAAAAAARRDRKQSRSMLIDLPASVAKAVLNDPEAVEDVLGGLLQGTVGAIMAGSGPVIREGVPRLLARWTESRVTVKLHVDETALRGLALVLGLPAASIATAYAIKAVQALGAREAA